MPEAAPIACPQCGAPVRPEEEDAFVACEFCGSRMYLDPDTAVRHEILPETVGRGELPARLGRWLHDREAVGKPRRVSTRLLWFPFWVLPDGHRGHDLRPAAALLVEGLDRFALPGGDRKAFREEIAAKGDLVPATVLLDSLVPGGEPPEGVRLVHLPFWEVSFELGAAEHRVWIDAAGGQVLAHTHPPSAEGRRDRVYAGVLGLTFVVLLVGFFSLFQGGGASVLGLALLVLAGPGAWAVIRASIARVEGG